MEEVRAWRPGVPGVGEVLHAHFTDHAYPAHVHDLWTVLLVDTGGVDYLLDGDWYWGVALGAIAVVMATLGDLVESVIKRDLGIKDMSQVIPGHGGLMDRLDSLLATVAPIWLLLHYAVL